MARWDLGSRGVRALAAVAVLVALVAGFIAWRARPVVEPLAPGPVSVAPASASTPTVVVAVSGRVRRPGLVRLAAGSRVADAIDAAGGVLPDTDLSGVNLARKVADGELIVVGIPPPSGAGPASGPGGGPGAGPGAVGLVNLNTATLDQLQTLPGVGPVLAQRIIEYRDQNGGFGAVADLRKVSGIGDARYDELKARVTV